MEWQSPINSKTPAPVSQPPKGGEELFISYARENREIVQKLQNALARRGREAWVDWTGIPPAGDWLETIKEGIEGAQVFIFAISPNALQSHVCMGEEVRYAFKNQKKIIPIVVENYNEAEHVPDEYIDHFNRLKKLNFIFLRPEDNFDVAVSKLIEALDTNLEHVASHTEFLRLAIGWEKRGRHGSRLLRGITLNNAENWLTGIGNKQPPANELQIHFIRASRIASKKKLRNLIASLTIGLIAVSLSSGVAFWQRNLSKIAHKQAEADAESARISLGDALVEQLRFTASAGRYDRARDIIFDLRDLAAVSPGVRRQAAVGMTDLFSQAHFTLISWDTGEEVKSLAISPDGLVLAIGGESGAKIYHAPTGSLIHKFDLNNGAVTAVSFSSDNKLVAIGGKGGLALWEIDAEAPKRHWSQSSFLEEVTHIKFTGDGQALIGANGKQLQAHRVADGERVWTSSPLRSAISQIGFSKQERQVYAVSFGGSFGLWNLTNGEEEQILPLQGGGVTGGVIIESQIAAISTMNGLFFYRLSDGKVIGKKSVHDGMPMEIALSEDGKTLITAGTDGLIRETIIINGRLATGRVGHYYSGLTSSADTLHLSRYLDKLAVSRVGVIATAVGQKVSLWFLNDSVVEKVFFTDIGGSGSFFSPDSRVFFIAGTQSDVPKMMDAYDALTCERLDRFVSVSIERLALDGEGRLRACRWENANNAFVVYDLLTGKNIYSFPYSGTDGDKCAHALAPGGDRLAILRTDGQLEFAKESGPWIKSAGKFSSEGSIRFTIDGSLLYTSENQIMLFAPDTYETKLNWRPEEDASILAARWASSLSCVLVLLQTGSKRTLWAVNRNGGEPYPLLDTDLGLNSEIEVADGGSLVYTHGGGVAAGGNQAIMRLWESNRGKELKVFDLLVDRISGIISSPQNVSISPDGEYVIYGKIERSPSGELHTRMVRSRTIKGERLAEFYDKFPGLATEWTSGARSLNLAEDLIRGCLDIGNTAWATYFLQEAVQEGYDVPVQLKMEILLVSGDREGVSNADANGRNGLPSYYTELLSKDQRSN